MTNTNPFEPPPQTSSPPPVLSLTLSLPFCEAPKKDRIIPDPLNPQKKAAKASSAWLGLVVFVFFAVFFFAMNMVEDSIPRGRSSSMGQSSLLTDVLLQLAAGMVLFGFSCLLGFVGLSLGSRIDAWRTGRQSMPIVHEMIMNSDHLRIREERKDGWRFDEYVTWPFVPIQFSETGWYFSFARTGNRLYVPKGLFSDTVVPVVSQFFLDLHVWQSQNRQYATQGWNTVAVDVQNMERFETQVQVYNRYQRLTPRADCLDWGIPKRVRSIQIPFATTIASCPIVIAWVLAFSTPRGVVGAFIATLLFLAVCYWIFKQNRSGLDEPVRGYFGRDSFLLQSRGASVGYEYGTFDRYQISPNQLRVGRQGSDFFSVDASWFPDEGSFERALRYVENAVSAKEPQ
jgi:hypothetical protein